MGEKPRFDRVFIILEVYRMSCVDDIYIYTYNAHYHFIDIEVYRYRIS